MGDRGDLASECKSDSGVLSPVLGPQTVDADDALVFELLKELLLDDFTQRRRVCEGLDRIKVVREAAYGPSSEDGVRL